MRLIPAYSNKCAMINPQKIDYGQLSIPYWKSKHRAYVMVYKPLEMDDYLRLIWENKLFFEHGKNCEMVMSLNYHRIKPTILWWHVSRIDCKVVKKNIKLNFQCVAAQESYKPTCWVQ